MRANREMARIEKKWSGLLTEVFTDKDIFRVTFIDPELTQQEREVLVAAAVYIDLQYFETKARSNVTHN